LGSSPKIERSYLNGENREAIVTTVAWPNAITLDYQSQKIFWADAKSSSIETADYSGLNRKVLFSNKVIYPFDIAVYGPWLYWTDLRTNFGLHQMNKTSGKLNFKLQIKGPRLGIVINEKSKQPFGKYRLFILLLENDHAYSANQCSVF